MRTILHVMLISIILIFSSTLNAVSGDTPSSLTTKPKDAPQLPKYLPETESQDKSTTPENSRKYFKLPPVPESKTPANQIKNNGMFQLNDVLFEGNTIFSDEELKKIAAPFINKNVGMADLEELRYKLTRYYVDKGYINSGALIKPNQKVTNGVLIYQIIEGRLTNIDVKGNGRLRENYIKKRIWSDDKAPFNTLQLQESFQLLLKDPLIERMDGNIVPGIKPGEAELDVKVKRATPYEVSLTAGNKSSPNLGSEKLSLNQTLRNLSGFGDSLNVISDITEGTREIDATWTVPINSKNTTLSFNYNYSKNDIISDSFKNIDIESELKSSTISLNHPIYRTFRRNINIGASLKSEESQTFTNDYPFAFAEGAVDGESKATVVQLSQSFDDRTTNQIMVLKSTFSFGVDLFSPILHSESVPDGEFVAWLGQVHYGRRFGGKAGELFFRGNLQLADDRLFSMEQFCSGGADSVRGYRENKNTGDNGYLLSIEWRIPLWESQRTNADEKTKLLQFAPFMDYGSAWERSYVKSEGTRFEGSGNEETIYYTPNSRSENTLHSIGAGLLWSSKQLEAQIYYGYAIEDAESESDYDIQDDGIHFSVTYNFL